MFQSVPGNVILIGFSGTGKSTVAKLVADALDWPWVDTDQAIAARFGKSIADIFRLDGEDAFRAAERDAVASACSGMRQVISVGGGVPVDPRNRDAMLDRNLLVRLDATPDTILARLRHGPNAEERPMLAGSDPRASITGLLTVRESAYSIVDHAVNTNDRSPENVVGNVLAWLATRGIRPTLRPTPQLGLRRKDVSELAIGRGILREIGRRMRDVGLHGRAFVVSDEKVFSRYGAVTVSGLRDGDFAVETFQLPDGETTKSLATARVLYDWLADKKAERIDAIVALGGGVVGDVAGFTAATFLRGMPLVQVPTTVLSQIDSSIGGKVGVNHPKGKNLIGAFHPARLIIGDVETLLTLSPRLLSDGWAEAIKCAMILDAPLLDLLDDHAGDLCDPRSRTFASDLLIQIIERCAQHKVAVVREDEREANLRMILNFGHTIAQGLEAALDYEWLLHGEAVSIGMIGAAAISSGSGFLDERAVARQTEVLRHFHLPTVLPSAIPTPSVDEVLDRMAQDKKSRGTRISWVLLDRIGHARIESAVPPELVRATVDRLINGSDLA